MVWLNRFSVTYKLIKPNYQKKQLSCKVYAK